ncbi:MAG: hypothetical protein K2G55_03175 [Lachnospiraceae bacterium]|nr:hypothetical protein [Lachnospiraceae bacterium]MDE7204079.1 hypothetical protein [Lachnospiraceae bacterium]
MIDKNYLKKHLQKREELKATIIRYNLLLSKEDISSPTGKSGFSSGGFLEFSTVENIVCKKILTEEKIKRLEKALAEQDTVINNVFEKLEKPYETMVMQMRYADGLEWDEIREGIFGSRKDYYEKIEKYTDKIFRIHGSALKHIKELQTEELVEE